MSKIYSAEILSQSQPPIEMRQRNNTMSSDNGEVYKVDRAIYRQEVFDETHGFTGTLPTPMKTRLKKALISRCSCTAKKFIMHHLPFIHILRYYKIPRWIPGDLIGGLTIGIMNLPQSIAYALLASLPPIMGLYTTFFPAVCYFFLGTSRHISVGSESVIALMVGSVVEREIINFKHSAMAEMGNSTSNATELFSDDHDGFSDDDPELIKYKVGIALTLTFLTGLWQLVMGVCGLGFLAHYLSDTLISAFTTGAAMLTFTSQIKYVFGIKVPTQHAPFKVMKTYYHLALNLFDTNVAELLVSMITIASLLIVKECINSRCQRTKLKMPVPIELLVVVVGTLVSFTSNLPDNYGVAIVGDIPTGIPAPTLEPLNNLRYLWLIIDAFWIALISFTISVSLGKLLGKLHDYEINPDQELLAFGVCNSVGSLFSTFCCGGAMSRSMVQHSMGVNTQLSGLLNSILTLVVMLFVGPLFRTLPRCILACIVLVALKGMFMQYKDLPKLWNISKYDFAMWIVMYLAVLLLGVDIGLVTGVGFSLFTIILRSARPYCCLYGQADDSDIYRDKTKYEYVKELDGIKIFHFEASLYYANADHFRRSLFKLTNANPLALKKDRRKFGKRKRRFEERVQKQLRKKEKDSGKQDDKKPSGSDSQANLSQTSLELQSPQPSHVVPTQEIPTISTGRPTVRPFRRLDTTYGINIAPISNTAPAPPANTSEYQEAQPSGPMSFLKKALHFRKDRVRLDSEFSVKVNPVRAQDYHEGTPQTSMDPRPVVSGRYLQAIEEDPETGGYEEYHMSDDIPVFEEEPPNFDISHIVLDCSAMMYTDAVGVKVLNQVINDYKNVDVMVLLADCRANFREMLKRIGFFESNPTDIIFLTIHDAVMHAIYEQNELSTEDDDINSTSGDSGHSEDTNSHSELSSSHNQDVEKASKKSSEHSKSSSKKKTESEGSAKSNKENDKTNAQGHVNEGYDSHDSEDDRTVEVAQDKFFLPA